MISRVKGTQDFLDLTLRHFISNQARKYLSVYHFSEIETPILEHTELYKRSLGTDTDIITKEMYTVDTGVDNESICLRPEATASTVRAFIENGIQTVPWKVYCIGSMFRHERPQKGRYRQFHQINMEIIGSASIAQDAHLIAMLDSFFSKALQINSYALVLNFLGCQEDRAAFKKVLHAFLEKNVATLCENCKIRKDTNIMRVYDCKVATCQELYQKAPRLLDYLCKPCQEEWQQLQDMLEMLSISFSIKHTLVRGLDYYSKTVFEFVSDNLGAQNAFCGGGRYDHLVSQLGGKEDQPSIGAAIGIERVLLLLEPIKDKLPLPEAAVLHAILPLSKAQQPLALVIAQELANVGLCSEVLLDHDSVKSMMRHANKLGAKYALLIGSDEQEKREVTVKNMQTGEEVRMKQTELKSYFKK